MTLALLLRNPPHTRSLSEGRFKSVSPVRHEMPHFDVHSFRKRIKKWTLWTLRRYFSGRYPFTSKTGARKRPFSASYPFSWSRASILFRPIPVHGLGQRVKSFLRSIPVHCRQGICPHWPFSGPYPFTPVWFSTIFVLDVRPEVAKAIILPSVEVSKSAVPSAVA